LAEKWRGEKLGGGKFAAVAKRVGGNNSFWSRVMPGWPTSEP